MAQHLLNFNNTQLPVGQTTVGPLTGLSANFSCTITINRTGNPSGNPWLNTLGSDSTLDLLIQSSPDGVTWSDEVESFTVGGTVVIKGVTQTVWTLEVVGLNPGATQAQGIVTVSGPSAIEVSGSVVAN